MTVPSATSRTNEAAERLRSEFFDWDDDMRDAEARALSLLDAALSEERRLERERIRERLNADLAHWITFELWDAGHFTTDHEPHDAGFEEARSVVASMLRDADAWNSDR